MIHGADDQYVKPVFGRIPVLLTDDDGDAHIHALCFAPRGMNLTDARNVVTDTFVSVRNADPEEWNYDDVTDRLTKLGFLCVAVSLWEEQADGYPAGSLMDDEDEQPADPGPPSPLNPWNPR
jgi:hypothetical protein